MNHPAKQLRLLFDQGAYGPAGAVLGAAKLGQDDPARKRELATLEALAEAYAAWDRFEHRKGRGHLETVKKNAGDLRSLFDAAPAAALLRQVASHQEHLDALSSAAGPGRAFVLDLLGNALRRARESRFDDAVARLYRAVEAVGQTRLREGHGYDSGRVELDRAPESLREAWRARAVGGLLKLGLQDDFLLLRRLNDPIGELFVELGLGDPAAAPPGPDGTLGEARGEWKGSLLSSRNQSILAHGFQPVGKPTYEKLFKAVMRLADLEEPDLPTFPSLAKMIRPAVARS